MIRLLTSSRWLAMLLVMSSSSLTYTRTTAATNQTAGACAGPEFHQFDFWLGDWDAFDIGADKPVARARISRLLEGCAILEEYEQKDGLSGKSINAYDKSRGVWHQTWVTNRGKVLLLEGHFANDEMTLFATEHLGPNADRQVRGVWSKVEGGVRETAVISVDGGKKWEPWFDMMFRPHKPAA